LHYYEALPGCMPTIKPKPELEPELVPFSPGTEWLTIDCQLVRDSAGAWGYRNLLGITILLARWDPRYERRETRTHEHGGTHALNCVVSADCCWPSVRLISSKNRLDEA
jgi:hypothetical protein